MDFRFTTVASIGCVLCFLPCSAFLRTSPCHKQNLTSDSANFQKNQTKYEIHNFGTPKKENFGSSTQTFYDFNLDIWMSGWYYNYWFEDLNFIPEAPSRYLLFKFFDDFLGNQGRIYPYLFTWSRLVTNIRAKLQEQAQKIKNPAWYTHDFFANLLEKTFTNRLGRGDFFDWFTKIFMVLTTTPYTYPVTDNQTFRTELRNNGAILRIPFEAYLPKRTDRENDHNYFFSIGSGVKIFPQAETLVTQTVFLSYFYVAPVLSYSERLFFKQPPLLRIKTEPDKTSIQDNEPAILQALQTIMFLSLSPAELHSYLALDPKTRTELIGQEPISFNANFLKSGSERPTTFVSKPFLIEQA